MSVSLMIVKDVTPSLVKTACETIINNDQHNDYIYTHTIYNTYLYDIHMYTHTHIYNIAVYNRWEE